MLDELGNESVVELSDAEKIEELEEENLFLKNSLFKIQDSLERIASKDCVILDGNEYKVVLKDSVKGIGHALSKRYLEEDMLAIVVQKVSV